MRWIRDRTGPAPSTGGRLVYAVGDIHGHSGELARLVAGIWEDARRTAPAEPPLLVFLGDYVDRGPDSRGVIDLILDVQSQGDFEVVALKGNHEEALLRFMADPALGPSWIANWGERTLLSYGVEPPDDPGQPEACRRTWSLFGEAFPGNHRAFLAGLRTTFTVGDYLFVHAGVRPGAPLDAQEERDLIWIRHEFLESEDDFGKVVVHGHTPALRPELRRNRIGVDTGVYFTGVLTAVRLNGVERTFLQARGPRPA